MCSSSFTRLSFHSFPRGSDSDSVTGIPEVSHPVLGVQASHQVCRSPNSTWRKEQPSACGSLCRNKLSLLPITHFLWLSCHQAAGISFLEPGGFYPRSRLLFVAGFSQESWQLAGQAVLQLGSAHMAPSKESSVTIHQTSQ